MLLVQSLVLDFFNLTLKSSMCFLYSLSLLLVKNSINSCYCRCWVVTCTVPQGPKDRDFHTGLVNVTLTRTQLLYRFIQMIRVYIFCLHEHVSKSNDEFGVNTLVVLCVFVGMHVIHSVRGWLPAYSLPAAVGLRSWERHEFIMQGCVFPQSHRCTHNSEGLGSLTFRTQVMQNSQWIKCTCMKNFAQLCPRDTVGTGGNTSDFLWYCSQHPTFLLQPSHPACKPQPPLITQPWLYFAHCFLHSPPFFFLQAVTKKTFGSNDFRSALENGILLCE